MPDATWGHVCDGDTTNWMCKMYHTVSQTYQTAVDDASKLTQSIHNMQQPIGQAVRNAESVMTATNQGVSMGMFTFHLLGMGALAWIGWQAVGYVAPSQKRTIESEVSDTFRRIRRRL